VLVETRISGPFYTSERLDRSVKAALPYVPTPMPLVAPSREVPVNKGQDLNALRPVAVPAIILHACSHAIAGTPGLYRHHTPREQRRSPGFCHGPR
jgi:hypothetical protein